MNLNKTQNKLLDAEFYIEQAERHGELSDPDHEVGDLQQYLRQAWALLSPEQRIAFARSDEVQDILGASAEVTEDLRNLETLISQSASP